MIRLALFGLVVLLSGCTYYVTLRNPMTGAVARCDRFSAIDEAASAYNLQRCIDSFERQGYARTSD